MSHGSCHSKNHAETVEHRNLNHHAVSCGEIHAVSDSLTVINYIVMCKHYALGEACGSRGVLHICNIMDIDRLSDTLNLAVWNFL